MKHRGMYVSALVCAVFMLALIGCGVKKQSAFIQDSFKPTELTKINYRVLKAGAVGESSGFKLVWIPFVSPTEGTAKLDMLNSLNKEGIQTAGKNIGFANATYDREMRGLLGLIGFPAIVLRADVIEVLGEQQPTEESSPQS
ncbi:MAG: hypothetical protein OEY28_07785 [Nitrospira sp.]|nr:hypothetical protein [Nitrospira sp.]